MKILIFFVVTICFSNAFAQCTLNNSTLSSSTSLNSTGNKELDNFISSEKIKLEIFFNVKVDLKITNGFNGLAIQKPNGTYSIELGKELLVFEYNKIGPSRSSKIKGIPLGKNMIMAIMAHEFAHIYQYSHPEFKFKNSVIQEIHADMLSGWYITKYFISNCPGNDIKTQMEYNDNVRSIFTDLQISFGWMGDKEYWSQQHHGNYLTRSSAFYEGWKDYKERGISDFNYFLKWSVRTAESLIRDYDSN